MFASSGYAPIAATRALLGAVAAIARLLILGKMEAHTEICAGNIARQKLRVGAIATNSPHSHFQPALIHVREGSGPRHYLVSINRM
jgi:hypothetical protein